MDTDLKYLLVTLGILVVVGAWHNVVTGEEDAVSFGYCDTELYCAGFEVSGYCLGVEQRRTSCIPLEEAEEYRRAEAECASQAFAMCEQGYSGTEWASNATYKNQTCRQWKEDDDRVTLIGCDQTFPHADTWESIE